MVDNLGWKKALARGGSPLGQSGPGSCGAASCNVLARTFVSREQVFWLDGAARGLNQAWIHRC